MRAMVQPAYGPPDVLEMREVPDLVPADGEVLIRVRAAGVNPQDWHLVTGVPYIARIGGGLLTPKEQRPGTDFAGDVEAVGPNVTVLQPGDAVFGMRRGAFADYICARADRLVAKP